MTVAEASVADSFLADLLEGLAHRPKRLPAKYLYDDIGSALFDTITLLPEYGVARAEERLLRRAVPAASRYLEPCSAVVELGSGNGRKARIFLEGLGRDKQADSYTAIDGSATALERCRLELLAVPVRMRFLETDYLGGLAAASHDREAGQQLVVLFLGSSIGNFDRHETPRFLRDLRARLRPGDLLFIGFDLEKPQETLIRAYDDPIGVTAAFNLNVLARANRELGTDFDLTNFFHLARWRADERSIEMHLQAIQPQMIHLPSGDVIRIASGETIWTESSFKYAPDEPARLAAQTGFDQQATWIDDEWPFADCLWHAQ